MRRLKCSLLVIVLICLSVTNVSFADDMFLSGLIVTDNSLNSDELITRGEFADIVAKTFFPAVVGSFEYRKFHDAGTDYKYFSSLMTLRDLGCINGDGFNNFYPELSITYKDAVTMLIKAMGYQTYAEEFGGYPGGYLAVAKKYSINKNISDSSEGLTRRDANVLIENALLTDKINVFNNNGKITIEKTGETILESLWNIEKTEAILVNDGFTDMRGKDIKYSDSVIFEEISTGNAIKVLTDDSELKMHLGKRMKVYIKTDSETGDKHLVHYEISELNKTILFNSTRLTVFNSNYIEYSENEEDASYKKLYFNTNPPKIIINGEYKLSYSYKDILNSNGVITAIDNNGDGKVELLYVLDFKCNIIASLVSDENKSVFCAVEPVNNLNLKDVKEENIRVIKNNVICGFDIIKENDVISAAIGESYGEKTYILYVSDKNISSMISEIYTSDNKLLLEDGSKLEVSAFLLRNRPDLFEELSGNTSRLTFFIDVCGNVAYVNDGSSSGKNFSYLIDLKPQDGVDSEVSLYMYSMAGAIEKYAFASNVKIDGISVKGNDFSGIQRLLCTRPEGGIVDIPDREEKAAYNQSYTSINPRPAIVQANLKNVIYEIDTDTPLYNSDGSLANEGNELVAGERLLRNTRFNTASSTYDGTALLNQKTTVFAVPDVDRYKMDSMSRIYMNQFEADLFDESNYSIYNGNALSGSLGYDIQIYNLDEDSGICEFALVRGITAEAFHGGSYTAPFAVFENISEYYDSLSGEKMHKIRYFLNGQEHSAVVDKDALMVWYQNIIFGGKHPSKITGQGIGETAEYVDVEPLKEGDIISLDVEGGYLTKIQREINISQIDKKTGCTYRSTAPSSPYDRNSYSETNVAIPFDMRYNSMQGYGNTFNIELGISVSLKGSVIRMALPLNTAGTSSTNWQYHIDSDYQTKMLNQYITFKNNNITVVEEINCDVSHDNCSYRVKSGSLADIKCVDSCGYDEASRLYYYNGKGSTQNLVIINLKASHHSKSTSGGI